MQLTRYSEHAHCALTNLALHPGRRVAVEEIAGRYRTSKGHLMKVVHPLGCHDVVETVRGRHGGLRLPRPLAVPPATPAGPGGAAGRSRSRRGAAPRPRPRVRVR